MTMSVVINTDIKLDKLGQIFVITVFYCISSDWKYYAFNLTKSIMGQKCTQ